MQRTTFEIDKNAYAFTRNFEGDRLTAYLCPANKWTISVGLTRYPNGRPVVKGDHITQEQSNAFFGITMRQHAAQLSKLLPDIDLTQNQINALVDFHFNIGNPAFEQSTIRGKILANKDDPQIRTEFMKWVYGGNGQHNGRDDDGDGLIDEPGEKQKLDGLIIRRQREADLYFSK